MPISLRNVKLMLYDSSPDSQHPIRVLFLRERDMSSVTRKKPPNVYEVAQK